MYEEHDTDARTHATDLNGVRVTVIPTWSSGGFFFVFLGDFTILFYYHEEITHPPHIGYSGIPSTSARAHGIESGTTHSALAVLRPSVFALDKPPNLGQILWHNS